ncbi:hypothetical protein T4D_8422 [Trichinella pseudospiralis]|uniref:Uncharacterized protein n=1 Tax=Trichinella pseudospiralis TaxID=6337 RepID=A0A0V1FR01_TRIPS|nr:hypothetical protein T4D_8422 [Trichinella pseudospiralis]
MCNLQCNTNNQIKSGINELCEMANMPGVGLEIFKAGGGWRDQKWAPPWSVKLPSLRQGRVQTLPCSLGRWSARFPTLERGKPKLSALKRWVRLSCFTCLGCVGSLVFFPCFQGRGDCVFCLSNRVRESAIFLALWAGGAHASRPWSGESLSFPR